MGDGKAKRNGSQVREKKNEVARLKPSQDATEGVKVSNLIRTCKKQDVQRQR